MARHGWKRTQARIALSLAGLIAAGLAALAGAAPAGAVTDADKPHLVAMLPDAVTADQHAPIFVDPLEQPGHLLYRFDSVIRNTGGALDLFALNPSSGTSQNDVRQVIWSGGAPASAPPEDPNADPTGSPGATIEDRTAAHAGATILYDSDPGHHHWHFLQAAQYTLQVPNEPPRGSGKVVGFCMVDSYDLGVPTSYFPEGYTGSSGDSNRTWCQYFQSPSEGGTGTDPAVVRMGISPGWGDYYESQDAGQWIDVTGLAPGDYTLTNTVNPNGYIDASPPVNGDDTVSVRRTIPGVTVAAASVDAASSGSTRIALSGSIVAPQIPARVSATGACSDENLLPTTSLASCYRTADAAGPLTFAIVRQPAHGTVALPSTDGLSGSVAYTPTPGYRGTDSFTYTATDARGLTSAPATISLSDGGAASGLPGCAAVPARRTPGSGGTVRLSDAQLLINQRISQAALRRLSGVEAWLRAGITTADLCGGSIGADRFGAGIQTVTEATDRATVVAHPRPVRVPAARARRASAVRISPRQLLINQRIAQAAVRRATALQRRLSGGLTGGDLRPAQITAAQLAPGFRIIAASQVGPAPAPSVTEVAAARHRAGVRLRASARQLRINQRVDQAAVRRADDLVALLERGLTGSAFRARSIAAGSLAPSAVGG